MGKPVSEVRDRLAGSISDAVKDEGDYVIKWVSLIEVLDEHGERCIWTIASDGSTSWDTLGLLQFALQTEQANHVLSRFVLREQGEEDE